MVQDFSEKSLRGLSSHEGLSYRGGHSGRDIGDWDDEADIKEVPMRKWPVGALRKNSSFKTSKAATDLMNPYKNESSHRSSLHDDPWGSSHHRIEEVSDVDTKSISVLESDFFDDDETRDVEEGGFKDEPSKDPIKKKTIAGKEWFSRRYRKYWVIIGATVIALVVLSSVIGTLASKDSSSSTIEKPSSSSLLEDSSTANTPSTTQANSNTISDQSGNSAVSIPSTSSGLSQSGDPTVSQSVPSTETTADTSSDNSQSTTMATSAGGNTQSIISSETTSGSLGTSEHSPASTSSTSFQSNPQKTQPSSGSPTSPSTNPESQTSLVGSSPSTDSMNEVPSSTTSASGVTQSTLLEEGSTVSSPGVSSSQATVYQSTSEENTDSSSTGEIDTVIASSAEVATSITDTTLEHSQQSSTQSSSAGVTATTQPTGPIAAYKLEIRVDEFAGDISSEIILHSTGDIIKAFSPDPTLEKYKKDQTELDLMQGQIYRLCAEDKGHNGIWRNGFLSILTTAAIPLELVHIDGDEFTSHMCKCFQVPIEGEDPLPSFTCPGHYIEIKRDDFPLEIKADILDFDTNEVVATMNPSTHVLAAEIERQMTGKLKKGHSYKLCGRDQAGDGIDGGYIKLVQVRGMNSVEEDAVYINGDFQQESCLCFRTPLDGEAIPTAHECPGFFVEIEKDEFWGFVRATVTERSTGVDIAQFFRSWDNQPSRSQNVFLHVGQEYELCISSQYSDEGGYVGIVQVQGAHEDFLVKVDASTHDFTKDLVCHCFSVPNGGTPDPNSAFVCSPTTATTQSTTSTTTSTATSTTSMNLPSMSTQRSTSSSLSETISTIAMTTEEQPQMTTVAQTVPTTTTTSSSTTTELTGPTAPFVLEIQVDENSGEISSEVALHPSGSVVASLSPDSNLAEFEKVTTDFNLVMGQIYRLCAEDTGENGIWKGGYLSIKSSTNPDQELVRIAGDSYLASTCKCFIVPEEGATKSPDFACPGHYIEIKRDGFPLETKAELTDIATNQVVDTMHPSMYPNAPQLVERKLTSHLEAGQEYKLCAYDQAGDGIDGGHIKLIQIAGIGSSEQDAVFFNGPSIMASSCLCFTVPKDGEDLSPAHECAGFAIEIEKDEFWAMATGTVTDRDSGLEIARFSRSGDNSPSRSRHVTLQSDHEYRFCISSEDPDEGGYAGVYQSSPDGNQGFLVKISGTENNFAAAPVCSCFTTPAIGETPDPSTANTC